MMSKQAHEVFNHVPAMSPPLNKRLLRHTLEAPATTSLAWPAVMWGGLGARLVGLRRNATQRNAMPCYALLCYGLLLSALGVG